MRKEKRCEVCGGVSVKLICDWCESEIEHGIAAELSFGYGSSRDLMDRLHFCSDECLCKYCAEFYESVKKR